MCKLLIHALTLLATMALASAGDWDQHYPSWVECDSDDWCNSQKQAWITDYPGDYRCQYKDPNFSHCCGGGGPQCAPMYRKLDEEEKEEETATVGELETRRFLGDWDRNWPAWVECDSDQWCNDNKQAWITDYPGDFRCQYKDPYFSHCCGGGAPECAPMY